MFSFQALKRNKEGCFVPRYNIAYSKATNVFSAKKILKTKSYEFANRIATESYKVTIDQEKASKSVRKVKMKKLFLGPAERPDKEEIIEKSTKYIPPRMLSLL